MSRVHDALRRAEQLLEAGADNGAAAGETDPLSVVVSEEPGLDGRPTPIEISKPANGANGVARAEPKQLEIDWRTFLSRCKVIPFRPAPETHLIDVERPHEVPAEEFRSLRTRLNHLQSQQDLHSIVITS